MIRPVSTAIKTITRYNLVLESLSLCSRSRSSSTRIYQNSGEGEGQDRQHNYNYNWIKKGKMDHSRYFVNPYSYEPESGFDINKLNRETIKGQVMEKAQEVFRNTTDANADAGLYLGPAGNSYMFIHILPILIPEERKRGISFAMQSYELHVKYYERSERVNTTGFLEGKLGVDAVGAVLGKIIGNEKMQNDCLTSIKSQASILSDAGFLKENGGDELFNGRAGFLYGALWLQQHFGFQPISRQDLKSIWKAIINSGKEYSLLTKNTTFPLMYHYYGTQYLGAAHGLCSILQVLISFPDFLNEEPEDGQLIKECIDQYLQLQDTFGNFPCALDEIGSRERAEEDKLVHFCHGAPGAIYLFAKAYLVYKEEKYLNSALQCGELVWQRGLLRKGPGICHGVGGNGYVFLLLWNLLERKDDRQLYRAYKYAEFLNHPEFKRARRPDCPYSLYEGDAGTACFLSDVVKPENSEFPFFNVYNNCKFT